MYPHKVNRSDFQTLATRRLEDAQVLLDNRRFDAAYYLSGYVIECALKACIAKKTELHDFPPEPKLVNDIYSHDLEKLVNKAGLLPIFQRLSSRDRQFEVDWLVVKDWSEKTRYESHGEKKAKDMLAAISDPKHGVLQCIKQYW